MRNIIFAVIMIVLSAVLIVVILFQESASEGLGRAAFVPANGSYYARNRGRSWDARLKKATALLGVLFFAAAAAMVTFGA